MIINPFNKTFSFLRTIFTNSSNTGVASRFSTTIKDGGGNPNPDSKAFDLNNFNLDSRNLSFKRVSFNPNGGDNSFLQLMRRFAESGPKRKLTPEELEKKELLTFEKIRHNLIEEAFALSKKALKEGSFELDHTFVSAGVETINIAITDGNGKERFIALSVWKLLSLTLSGAKRVFIEEHNLELLKACGLEYSIIEYSKPCEWKNPQTGEAVKGYWVTFDNIDLSTYLDTTKIKKNSDSVQRLGSVEYGLLLMQEALYQLKDFPYDTDLPLDEISRKHALQAIKNGYRLMAIPFRKKSGEMSSELFQIKPENGGLVVRQVQTFDSDKTLKSFTELLE